MSDGISNARIKRERRHFIGGSDARIIMGQDETALLRLWREKRGEAAAEDLSANLIVQLGNVTEDLNRRWFETNTSQVVVDVQRHVRRSRRFFPEHATRIRSTSEPKPNSRAFARRRTTGLRSRYSGQTLEIGRCQFRRSG
jgi:hypothetical protein